MISLSFSAVQIMSFTVVLFRVAGIVIFSPFYSSGAFPIQVKVILPLIVALNLTPLVPSYQLPPDFDLVQVVTLVFGETLVGVVLGITSSFIFGALQLAGQIAGFQLGFSIINTIDPQTAVESSVISILNNFIGLALFLTVNGHHWFFQAVSDSLNFLPVGGVHLRGPLVEEVLRLSGQMFSAGLRIAGPVIVVTVIADVVLGLIGRAAPQIHVLMEGMAVKILVGMAGLSVALYFLPNFLNQSFLQLSRDMMSVVRGLI
jgi:flagellar biosynthetic protein FliR